MRIQSMKVHQLARGFWDNEPPSLNLTCKRLRPTTAAPNLSTTTIPAAAAATSITTFDVKSFIRPETGPRKTGSSEFQKKEAAAAQVEAQPGGTRWNPTPEQIGILEMLYRGGMRTPNAQQIEQITSQLGRYGKIEGKNVFYWFQNHKARERQKQKRNNLGLNHSPRTPPSPFSTTTTSLLLSANEQGDAVGEVSDSAPQKRKCSSWAFDQFLEEANRHCTEEERNGEDRTLKLFPLHPEGRS